jgi:hypothetical protein
MSPSWLVLLLCIGNHAKKILPVQKGTISSRASLVVIIVKENIFNIHDF